MPKIGDLSRRQQAILDFIKQRVKQKGYPPSVREIGEAVGLASSSTVHGHLARLEKKGYIRRDPTKPRAIEILHDPPHDGDTASANLFDNGIIRAPIVGKVTAGLPITAIEHIEDYFPLPAQFVGDGDLFLLHVEGDSMIDAGILDKDLVVVRKQEVASNGDIVVAMNADGEATVKRFYKEDGHFRLQPENPTMAPIILDEVKILGKVIGVFRFLQ